MDRIHTKTRELQNAVNKTLEKLPSFLVDLVISKWNEFTRAINGFWDQLNEAFAYTGSPSKLTETADAWNGLVGGPVSGQVLTADAGTLQVDNKWEGDAADAYRATLPQQKAALDKVKTALTDGITSGLSDVAGAITSFWRQLLVTLGILAAGIVGAIVSAGTIFGLPAAPVVAGLAVVVAVGSVWHAMSTLEGACSSAANTMQQRLADNSAFRGGHWPSAVRY